MWPFQRNPTNIDLVERLEKLERTNREERERLERAFRQLDSDMDSLWDKVKHWTGRMAKRLPVEPGLPEKAEAAAQQAAIDWNQKILEQRRRRGISTGS